MSRLQKSHRAIGVIGAIVGLVAVVVVLLLLFFLALLSPLLFAGLVALIVGAAIVVIPPFQLGKGIIGGIIALAGIVLVGVGSASSTLHL